MKRNRAGKVSGLTYRQKAHGFTLVELLVVIGIIAVLAALILTAVDHAKAEARRTACMSNLKNFGVAIAGYQGSYEMQYPMWLSQMDDTLDNPGIFRCPNDDSRGRDGSIPNELTSVQAQYAETNDMPDAAFTGNDANVAYNNGVNPLPRKTRGYIKKEVDACSYLYEWTEETCSWSGESPKWTWRAEKTREANPENERGINILPDYSDVDDSPGAPKTKTLSKVPVVRCFFHQPREGGVQDPGYKGILNLRIDLSAIKSSPPNFWWID